ncbi:hypothetical protein EVA_18898 [gut metagenome]|uniref:Uncharacterized protein n=1 Tax=gut metagenome TaxID=749906 RepID=J9G071_9ZZZZ
MEFSHVIFPFSLTGKGGKAFHRRIPIKIYGCFNNHEEPCAENIDFHFEDTYFADASKDFLPSMFRTVTFAIFSNECGIVFEVKSLTVTFYRAVISLSTVACLGSFFHKSHRLSPCRCFPFRSKLRRKALLGKRTKHIIKNGRGKSLLISRFCKLQFESDRLSPLPCLFIIQRRFVR